MSNRSLGPGVQKFWAARTKGKDVDVEAIVQEYPDEALELADAIWEAARLEDSEARERMWIARAQVLGRSGEERTLGALLRFSRVNAGLSATELSSKVRARGVTLPSTAIEQLEADRVKISNVKTPGLWSALAEILQIDLHRLMAMIRDALSGPRPEQRFTRMERESTQANRKSFLSSDLTPTRKDEEASYINWVRTELGLPTAPTDTVQ